MAFHSAVIPSKEAARAFLTLLTTILRGFQSTATLFRGSLDQLQKCAD